MALIDDVRTALRGRSEALDSDIAIYIGAAIYDLKRSGVDVSGLWRWDSTVFNSRYECPVQEDPEYPPQVKTAIILYVKGMFGTGDPGTKDYFMKAYEHLKLSLVLDEDLEEIIDGV